MLYLIVVLLDWLFTFVLHLSNCEMFLVDNKHPILIRSYNAAAAF